MSEPSGLLPNLRHLYFEYGGLLSAVRSGYALVALACSCLAWRHIATEAWASMAVDALPSIIGFSIAAYALLFSLLDTESRKLLRSPSPALNGRSPLMALASAIPHALVIQTLGFLIAVIYQSKPFPTLPNWSTASQLTNWAISCVGLFLFLYGIILVLGASLSIFKLIGLVVTPTSKTAPESATRAKQDT